MSEKESILIVEDADVWAKRYEQCAENVGVEAVIVTTAEEAVKLLEEGSFSLVITDGLEGEWAMIHDAVQTKAGVKILVISGSGSREREAREREVDFMHKFFFDPQKLQEMITSR